MYRKKNNNTKITKKYNKKGKELEAFAEILASACDSTCASDWRTHRLHSDKTVSHGTSAAGQTAAVAEWGGEKAVGGGGGGGEEGRTEWSSALAGEWATTEKNRGREAGTHPQEGREAQAVVAHSKVVWFGPDHFHNVLVELGLFALFWGEQQHITHQSSSRWPASGEITSWLKTAC